MELARAHAALVAREPAHAHEPGVAATHQALHDANAAVAADDAVEGAEGWARCGDA